MDNYLPYAVLLDTQLDLLHNQFGQAVQSLGNYTAEQIDGMTNDEIKNILRVTDLDQDVKFVDSITSPMLKQKIKNKLNSLRNSINLEDSSASAQPEGTKSIDQYNVSDISQMDQSKLIEILKASSDQQIKNFKNINVANISLMAKISQALKQTGVGGAQQLQGGAKREEQLSLTKFFRLPDEIIKITNVKPLLVNTIKQALGFLSKDPIKKAESSVKALKSIIDYTKNKTFTDNDKLAIVWALAKILYNYPLAIMSETSQTSALDIFEQIAPVTINGTPYTTYSFLLKIYDWAFTVIGSYVSDLKAGRTYAGLCQDLDYVINYPMKLKNFIEKSQDSSPEFEQFKKDVEAKREQVISLMKKSDWNTIRNSCTGIVLPTLEDYQELTEVELERLQCRFKKGEDPYACFTPFLNDLDSMYKRSLEYKDNFEKLNPLMQKAIRDKFLSNLNKLIHYIASPSTCTICLESDLHGALRLSSTSSTLSDKQKKIYEDYVKIVQG